MHPRIRFLQNRSLLLGYESILRGLIYPPCTPHNSISTIKCIVNCAVNTTSDMTFHCYQICTVGVVAGKFANLFCHFFISLFFNRQLIYFFDKPTNITIPTHCLILFIHIIDIFLFIKWYFF